MGTLRSWLAAGRPGQALLGPLCVAVGTSYAHFDAQEGPGLAAEVVVTMAAFAAALGVNLIDHAWDRLGAPPPDPRERESGSPMPLDAKTSAAAAFAALALAALGGFALVRLSGSAALGYGALAVCLGALRRAPIAGFDSLGWGLGELAAFVALGPLTALAGFASQTGSGSWGAFLAGVPAGLVAMAALFGMRAAGLNLDAGDHRRSAVALPLFAAAAVAIAVRAREYGPWADLAALPMAVASALAWRLSAPRARLVLVCSIAALCAIIAALRMAPHA